MQQLQIYIEAYGKKSCLWVYQIVYLTSMLSLLLSLTMEQLELFKEYLVSSYYIQNIR